VTDNEQKQKPTASARIRMALYITLGLALVCLMGGNEGWIISGLLFFFVAGPLVFALIPLQLAERKNVEPSKTIAPALFKLLIGVGVEAASVIFFNHWAAITGPPSVVALLGVAGMIVGLWPLLDGAASLLRTLRARSDKSEGSSK
jgi:small-conductance mechanosensitive channel